MVQQTTTNADINGYVYQPTPSFQELYDAFMKMDKETLAMLLATKQIADLSKPSYPTYPTYPVYPPSPYPWITWYTVTC